MKTTSRFLLVISLIALMFTGCVKKFRCTYDSCGVKAPDAEIQQVRDYLTANGITATQHCSGLFYKIETGGTGKNPEPCSNVAASYVGKLTDGTVFDQSPNPVSFSLQQVIAGWTNGVPLIKEGGKIILYIPPSLGYGSRGVQNANGSYVIPPNAVLIFEVSLAQVL